MNMIVILAVKKNLMERAVILAIDVNFASTTLCRHPCMLSTALQTTPHYKTLSRSVSEASCFHFQRLLTDFNFFQLLILFLMKHCFNYINLLFLFNFHDQPRVVKKFKCVKVKNAEFIILFIELQMLIFNELNRGN